MPGRDDYLRSLADDAATFAAIVADADLDLAVPSCPGWTLRDLASHLGGVHRWAEGAVATGAPGDAPIGPYGRFALHAWFVDGSTRLVERLSTTDPDSPTWTFGPHPRVVSFWVRRQAHETSMHLGDALRALGRGVALDPSFAADGVDEVVGVFFPRQVRLGRIPPLARGITLVLDDVGDRHLVLAGDGTDPAAPTDATASGRAADVLLALWGRAGAESLAVDGDPDVLHEVLTAGVTP